MGKVYFTNAFSLNMVAPEALEIDPSGTGKFLQLRFHSVTQETIINVAKIAGVVINAIGHADLAAIVHNRLHSGGFDLPPAERVSIQLQHRDRLLIAQYIGPRLPEKTTTLPEGAAITWIFARFYDWEGSEDA